MTSTALPAIDVRTSLRSRPRAPQAGVPAAPNGIERRSEQVPAGRFARICSVAQALERATA